MIGPPKESWVRLVRATHLYEHGNSRQSDGRDSWNAHSKLPFIAILLFVAANQTDVINQIVFRLGVWLTSAEPFFTACAFGIAVMAGATRRELIGIGAAVVLTIAYTGLLWVLFPAERSIGQFADWAFIRTWLATLYILIVSVVMRTVVYLRTKRPSPAPPNPDNASDTPPA